MLKSKEYEDKVCGALYGFAIGDAMGATTEFMTENQIVSAYGKVVNICGGGWLKLKPGSVTDDTQMSICVMDAIMASGGNRNAFEEKCIENFIKWYKSNPPDLGGQCAQGIMALMAGERPHATRRAGNGSLMRALPCALVGKARWNILQSELTHMNAECTESVKWYHNVIWDIMNGIDISKHVRFSKNILMKPTGYVKDTMYNARIWACAPSVEECIVGAVNHGGDADTIAAIAGSISGAKYGYNAIPDRWIRALDYEVKNILDKFTDFCCQTFGKGV